MPNDEDVELIDMMESDADNAQASAPAAKQKSIREVIEEARQLEIEVQDLEAKLKDKKSAAAKLKQKVLPKMLDEIGTNTFSYEDENGNPVVLEKDFKVSGSLSKAPDIEAAIEYLTQEGLTGAVKTSLTLQFDENELELADQEHGELQRRHNQREVLRDRSIAPATLAAFGRRRKKENPSFDYEKVGLTAFTQTKFTKL